MFNLNWDCQVAKELSTLEDAVVLLLGFALAVRKMETVKSRLAEAAASSAATYLANGHHNAAAAVAVATLSRAWEKASVLRSDSLPSFLPNSPSPTSQSSKVQLPPAEPSED